METKIEQARRPRVFMEKMSSLVDDVEILAVPEICPYWKVGETDGGVINLQYLPHELVGHYFVLAV